MEVGYKIRQIRTLKGLNQENMAAELGISQKAYSLIEKGETRINPLRLEKIAHILGVSKDDIEKFNSEKIIHQTNNDSATGYVTEIINQQNQQLIEDLKNQYESRITDLKKEIEFLKTLIKK